jgi:molybdopterin molybdotransferase
MLTYEQAITQILEQVTLPPRQQLDLLDALGLVCAEDVQSPLPLPPFTNSAMDGYAVRYADVATLPVSLPLHGESAAGTKSPPDLQPGTAVRILTGAPLPAGADTVIPQEEIEIHERHLRIQSPVQPGQFVRAAGEDLDVGARVIAAETVVGSAQIALLAAVGRQQVSSYGRPRIALISTGNELTEPGQPLAAGQIYNSNSYALAAQVMEAGGVVTQRVLARDTPEALRAALDSCAEADILLTSGGVSVGDHDHVKEVFSERGTLDFWRVAIRPGKPLAFGAWGKTLFFGLPGNPVSAMVTFELFVRPALLKMRGITTLTRPLVQAEMRESTQHRIGRRSYQRAIAWEEEDGWKARPLKKQGSHQMQALSECNALLIVPHDLPEIVSGEYATVMLLT